ncbi:MAG: integrase arm-type DNA-binding domain-containing protein [Rhizobiales bacterium]|nr:integrase arm-type DNA-binding domain-containing protein [Hyphomicrobiales bacterium]
MPTIKLTKSAIDALTPESKDAVHWDAALPGFGLKITPKGRKVFIVLYRTKGGGSRLRKYTIGRYGSVTLHQARAAAQRIFAARLDGRDPATEKLEARRRHVVDRVDDLVETFITEHLSKLRSGDPVARLLRQEFLPKCGSRSVHDLKPRDISDIVFAMAARRTAYSGHKLLKAIKRFFSWCRGRAILEVSPALAIVSPGKSNARDRVLSDDELRQVLRGTRQIGGAFGAIVEFLALTGQRREEVAQMTWDELDLSRRLWVLPARRAKNGKPHTIHLSREAMRIIAQRERSGPFVFSATQFSFQRYGEYKKRLDKVCGVTHWQLHDLRRTCVSGMAGLGIAPHVADKILNHQSGTISGVAAVYQRHEFLAERKEALERWGAHVADMMSRLQSGEREAA